LTWIAGQRDGHAFVAKEVFAKTDLFAA
jgi:phosphoenolpyruvate carboxylase